MKVCLIEQSGGLGDILFTLKIGAHYIAEGYRVIWPVQPVYENLNKYIKAEGIEFYNIEKEFPYKREYQNFDTFKLTQCTEAGQICYVPLNKAFQSSTAANAFASQGHEARNMFGKYAICGIDWADWVNYFDLHRDYEKESQLWSSMSCADPIHLINRVFGTPPRWHVTLQKEVEFDKALSPVEMRQIKGYSLFDWCGIIERSQKIDTVATGVVFLFEKISLNCIPTIHSRNKEVTSATSDFELMKKIYSKEYIYEV
jgi:hypothetical protein